MSSPDREEEHKEKKKQQIQYDETNAGAAAVDLGFGTRRSTLRWTESPCRSEPLPCAILRVLTLAVTRSFAFGTSVPPLEQFPKSLLVPLKTRPSRVAELRVNATPVRCFFFLHFSLCLAPLLSWPIFFHPRSFAYTFSFLFLR